MNTPTKITRLFHFDAGHRVYGHESKCAHLHGHRYVAAVTVTASELDDLGRVIDFSVLKSRIGKWINHHWDHNLLLNAEDPFAKTITVEMNSGKELYLFERCNPTAENMARRLFSIARMLLFDTSIKVVGVRVYETPNCWADYGFE